MSEKSWEVGSGKVERKVSSFYSLDARATQPHVLGSLKKNKIQNS
jgi:hypothetical protein